ncbi:MAG: lipid A deacylase LpxR family protein, partial [Opitutales bacterium]
MGTGLDGRAQNATTSPATATATVSQASGGAGNATMMKPPGFPEGQWLLTFQNDWFYGTDRDLTNSLSLYYITPNAEDWSAVPGIPDGLGNFFNRISLIDDKMAVVSGAFYAQQTIWTPANLLLNPPSPNDRPYAGWVGMGIDMARQTGYRRAILEITPGWVGPESGAQQLQSAWHSVIKDTVPPGWYYQIKNEPVLQLTYRQDWRPAALTNLDEAGKEPLGHDVLLHGLATVGNGWDYAEAGFLMRLGYHLP